MPHFDGEFTGTNGSSLHRKTSGQVAGLSAGGGSPRSGGGASSAMDNWLMHKLKNEWSSCDLGPLLTRERISEAVSSFPHLDMPIKVRLLLSFLTMRREDFDENKLAIVEIIDAAENDSEEWVKVGAGIVNQYLFMTRDGAESDTFLHDQLASASAKVLEVVNSKRDRADALIIEDFFCHENAYLSASVRPELAVKPAAHFMLAETARETKKPEGKASVVASGASKLGQRPPLARTHLPQATVASASVGGGRSGSQAAKPPPPLASKKNMSELSSEIRRKADAGRFKRQRSRISVIDLDEVKQIESEKAQKAEEQKKRLKATKEERKGTVAGANGSGSGASGAGGGGGDKHDDGGDDEEGHVMDSDHEDHHDSEYEDANSSYLGSQDDHGASSGSYTQDGTQALLHAAFHSTGDVMMEVVAQQQQQHPHPNQHTSYYSHQSSSQSLYSTRGFEPEDAHGSTSSNYHSGYGYNTTGYSSQFGDQAPPYSDDPQYNNGGFGDDHSPAPDQPGAPPRYESHRFADGPPPDLWR